MVSEESKKRGSTERIKISHSVATKTVFYAGPPHTVVAVDKEISTLSVILAKFLECCPQIAHNKNKFLNISRIEALTHLRGDRELDAGITAEAAIAICRGGGVDNYFGRRLREENCVVWGVNINECVAV